jgi:hypothetical protein
MRGALEKILILMRSRTGTISPTTRKTRSIAGSSAAWAFTRSTRSRLCAFPERESGGTGSALQGTPHRRDGFFPRPDVWQLLRDKTLPELLARHPTRLLRAWVAGCSTGEEAYTLAIVFREVVEKLKPGKNFKLQIFATDLDRDAIDKARQGVFSETSPRISLRSNCAVTSPRRKAATGCAPRSAKW